MPPSTIRDSRRIDSHASSQNMGVLWALPVPYARAMLRDTFVDAIATRVLALYGLVALGTYAMPKLWVQMMPAQNLRKKYGATWALVTGGSTGIGRSLAEALLDQGLNVAIAALDDEALVGTGREQRLHLRDELHHASFDPRDPRSSELESDPHHTPVAHSDLPQIADFSAKVFERRVDDDSEPVTGRCAVSHKHDSENTCLLYTSPSPRDRG